MRGHGLQTLLLGIVLICTLSGCGSRPVAVDISVGFPIPIYLDSICIPLTIDGREHLCVVDSGAGAYVFDPTLREKLGASVSSTQIALPDGSLARAELYKVPDARIGAIALNKNALALCYDLTSIRESSGRNIEGIIGLPLFQTHIVQLDFDAHRLVISSPSTAPESAWGEPIGLSYNEAKLPKVLIDFGDGISEQCIVDTGYDGPVWLSKELQLKLVDQKLILAGGEIPISMLNGHRTVPEGIVRYMKIGSIEDDHVLVRKGTAESRIGLGYLRRFRVTIDIPHSRIYLAKGAEFEKPAKQRAVGMRLLRKSEKTVVNWIEPESPAEDAGIAVNDELGTVAGEPIAGRPLGEIYWMVREKADPGGKLKLGFRRSNKERSVEVTIGDLSEAGSEKTAILPNHPEAAVIAGIQRLGGQVRLDEDAPGKPVYGVNFSETRIGDDDLKSVEGLSALRVLTLSHTRVTDAGLKHIEGLTELRTLFVDDTRLTDAGLEHIQRLAHLEYLDLSSTRITDAGLRRIKGLLELHSLTLDDTRITDEGLKELKGLKHLERLYVLDTKITPLGLKQLQHALPNLHCMGDDFDDIPH